MTEIRSLVIPRHSCQPRATLHSSWYVEPATHLSATQGVGDGKQSPRRRLIRGRPALYWIDGQVIAQRRRQGRCSRIVSKVLGWRDKCKNKYQGSSRLQCAGIKGRTRPDGSAEAKWHGVETRGRRLVETTSTS